ncbi:MAG: hypothetical protein ACOVOV_17905 [Dolichospermum sp.]
MNFNIAAMLQTAINNLGGQCQALQACENMYSAQFRSEPFPLSEVGSHWQDSRYSLFVDHAVKLYCKTHNLVLPQRHQVEDFERYCDLLDMVTDEALAWLNGQGFDIDSDTMVIELCNYKGEGEGLALFEGNEQLPVFISKNHSFYQANNF